MFKKLSGSGGMFGGGSTPTETDDNLFSTDIVEAILGVSEGPIKGLKDGPKTFLLGETPLKNVSGDNNFDSFQLTIRKGSELGERIISRMGGFASSTSVGTTLATNVPVVRQGTNLNIDYVDIRLTVSRLLRQTNDGTFNHTGRIKIEYKKTASPTWLPVTTITNSPPPAENIGVNEDVYTDVLPSDLSAPSPGDRPVYRQNAAPSIVAGQTDALWFDADDNNRPYKISGSSWVVIPGAVFGSGVWTWSEASPWGGNKSTKIYVTVLDPPETKAQADYWIKTSTNEVFMFNGSSWIVAGSSLSPGTFGGTPLTLVNGELAITGKTTTSFVKEFRFPIENIGTDTYQFRITKTSPANTSEEFFDVSWESFQEVIGRSMIFPGLATAQVVARASEQFSSIPQMSGIYEGRVVKVPINYNPETRIYTGVWDGTWKQAYTNNPAYIVNDLVDNDRYGLNAYYPVVINKWDVYEAGVWCDTLTEDGFPRFKFNLLLDTPRNCREAIDFICGIFGGRFFDDGNGSANIRIDKPSAAQAIFAKENVVDGIFSYGFTETTSRYNDLTVTFKNPELGHKEDRVRVFDQDHIDAYGRIPLNFIAVGCNSREEAIVRGRYKLATGLSERAIVNFKTNRQGLYLEPYNIILVVDEDMESGISGRVKDVTGPKKFSLRDPVYLEAGFNYKVMFQIPDGSSANFLVVEREIAPGTTGTFREITTLVNLPDLPEQAVFTISTVTDDATPQAFRITRISEIDGDPDNVEIEGIEVNRLKWDYVDGIIDDPDNYDHYDLNTGGKTAPVPAVRIRPFNTFSGTNQVHNVFVDWDPSPTKTVSHYKVYVSRDNSPPALMAETRILSFEYNNLVPGEYLFTVVAVSSVAGSGAESIPTTIEHRFVGDVKDPTRITDLRLIDEASTTQYARRSPSFAWTPITTPNHRDYVVRIYDPVGGVVVGQHYVRDSSFVYDYQTNRADHSMTAVRQFDIGVASRDQFDGLSPFNIISVNNPPPGATVPAVASSLSSANITWNTTGLVDYQSAKVWISTSPGFTPAPANLVYEGEGSSFTFINAIPGTYYVRIALLDNFNDTDYNISTQVSFSLTGIDEVEISEDITNAVGTINNEGPGTLSERLAELEARIAQQGAALANHMATNKVRTSLLTAQNNGVTAAVAREERVRADENLAMAALIDEVVAELEENLTADGLFRIQAEVDPLEAKADILFRARAQIEDAFGLAALRLRAEADGMGGSISSVEIMANQLIFIDNTGNQVAVPFQIVGGEVVIQQLRFRTMKSIATNSGVPIITLDGDTGFFSFGT